jgi:hypothetical protein
MFEKALIKVENEKEFEELRTAVNSAFVPERIESFLKRLRRRNIRIRDFDSVLAQGVLEEVAGGGKSGVKAQQLYEALPVSDQAQMREFYLTKIEEIDPALRARFQRLYQYY